MKRGPLEQLAERQQEMLDSGEFTPREWQMAWCHFRKPWVSGFRTVAIRPTKTGSGEYLDIALCRALDSVWYFPSVIWWKAHAKTSHPPDGSGCSIEAHTKFLTEEGTVHEFDYANILWNGNLVVLGRPDFVVECKWWEREFPR